MADFGYCWRTVRLYCPSAPTFLAREWVNAAWRQLLQYRAYWGFARKNVTFSFTGGDPTIAGSVGAALPHDFQSFVSVVNVADQKYVPFSTSVDEILKADPALAQKGTPDRLIVTAGGGQPPWDAPQYLGRLIARGYPVPSGPSTYTAVYNTAPARLDDTTVLPDLIAQNAEVLVTGALAQAALWPGTGDKPNPYFNAGVATAKAAEFHYALQMLSLRDDDAIHTDSWDAASQGCGEGSSGADPRTTDCSC